MNKKTGAGIVIIGLLIVIGLLMGIVSQQQGYFDNLKNGKLNKKRVSLNDSSNLSNSMENDCENGWQKYRQKVIGIEFCYPRDKWGEAKLGPVSLITDLERLLKNKHYYQDSSRNSNGYYNIMEISFEKPEVLERSLSPVVRLMRSEASVNKCSDSNIIGGRMGCDENVSSLKKHQDICKYSIDYKKQGTLREVRDGEGLREVYNDCQDGLKTTLSEVSNYFNHKDSNTKEVVGWKYQYFLDIFAYKKMQNGYFDDALIYYNIDSSSQRKNKLADWKDFFELDHSYKNEKRITLTEREFKQRKSDFEKFVKSIKVFKPVVEDLTRYKSALAVNDSGIKLIEKYYWLLTQGNLKKAYLIKSTNESLTNFEKQYKNIHFARPYNFKKIGNSEYTFFVEYQDHNSPVKIYQIKMSVVDDRVKTNFVQMFITERVERGDMVAYSAVRGDKSYVILEKDGKEIVVDEGESKYDEKYTNIHTVKLFRDVKFSPNGDYLKYAMMGYEWGSSYVYDIQNSKGVVESSMTLDIKFTPDGKYVYYCAGAGMINTREGIVKSVPNFKEEYSVFGKVMAGEKYPQNNEYFGVTCDYDKSSNEVVFKLSDLEGKIPEKIVKYKLK